MICIDRFDVLVCGRFAVKSAKMKEIVPRICRERVNPAQNKVVRWVKGANKNVLINFGGRITKKKSVFFYRGQLHRDFASEQTKMYLGGAICIQHLMPRTYFCSHNPYANAQQFWAQIIVIWASINKNHFC